MQLHHKLCRIAFSKSRNLRQYRTEIVRILRRQIYSAFAFLCGTSCAAWANAFRLRVGGRLYKLSAGGLVCRSAPLALRATSPSRGRHARQAKFCARIMRFAQNAMTENMQARCANTMFALLPQKCGKDAAQQRATDDKAVRRSLCGIAL